MSEFLNGGNMKNIKDALDALLIKYKVEFLVFFGVFILVFSSKKMYSVSASKGNVEQWVNITNQMFYGGSDFLFSYGPLYWLVGGSSSQYSVVSYWAAILFISVISAAFWSLIVKLVHNARAYMYLGLAFFLFFSTVAIPSAFYLLPFALIVYFEFSKEKPMALGARGMIALGVLVGFLFYVRFFYGLVGVAVFGSYFFIRLFSEKKISGLLCFVAATLVSYVFVGLVIFHDAASIVNYLIVNKNLSFGNSVDMTLDVVNSKRSLIAVFLVVAVLNIYLLLRRRALLLTVNVLLLLLFKLGFSRTDHYLSYFVMPVAAMALVMVFDKSRIGRVLFLMVMVALYYLAANPSFPGAPTKDSLLPGTDFSVEYEGRMQSIYADFKLDESFLARIGKSTIDVYPYNNEYAFANKLNYAHRPSFQNYMTLTPTLDSMNKVFFESSERPRFVLWTGGLNCIGVDCNVFDGFDNKYSLNEDPLTVNAILLNYHVVGISKGVGGVPLALMEANEEAREDQVETTLSETAMTFDKWYKVPKVAGGVVKVIPNFELTLYAQLKNLLFRGNILKIRYKLVSGDVREYRLNVLSSKSGVWITPLLDNFEFSGDVVDSIMFVSDSSRYFRPELKAKWIGMPLSSVHNKPLALSVVSTSVEGALKSAVVSCEGNLDLMNGVSPAPTKLLESNFLKVQGWLAYSTKNGMLFDKTYLTLTDEKGKKLFILAKGEPRADVGAVFKNTVLNAAGFKSLMDLSALSGDYKLGMGGLHGSEFFNCSQFEIPLSVER